MKKAGNGTNIVYESSHTSMGLGFGLIWESVNLYTDVVLKDEAEGANVGIIANDSGMKYDGELGLKIGGSYNIFGVKVFGEYESNGFEINPKQAGAINAKYEQTNITIGVGKIHEVAGNARVMTDVTFQILKDEGSDPTSITNTASWSMVDGTSDITGQNSIKTKKNILNATFGMEADATSWLTLRASVKQAFYFNQHSKNSTTNPESNDKTNSSDETTNVNAGATFNFGNLKLDGLIGTDGSGFLNTDNLLVRTALHYWF